MFIGKFNGQSSRRVHDGIKTNLDHWISSNGRTNGEKNSIEKKTCRKSDKSINSLHQDRLDQFLQRFNVHYSDEIDEKTTHLITDDSTIPFVCALSSKVVHALARHLTVLSIRWIDECLRCDKLILDESALQFEIRGDLTCSTMFHGGMQRSRMITRRHSLFAKHIFMLKCAGVQNVGRIQLNFFFKIIFIQIVRLFS